MKTFTTNLIKNFVTKVTTPRFSRYASGLCLILTMLFTLGVGEMWGASTVNGGEIYFDASTSGWGSPSTVEYVISHDSYSCWYKMTSISNTKLYHITSASWGDAKYIAFTGNYGWTSCEGNSYDSRKGYGPSGSKRTAKSTYGVNSGSYYLFYAASSSNDAAITTSSPAGYLGSGKTHTALNYTQTLNQTLSTDGGSTYSASTLSLATVGVSSYELNGKTSTTSSSGSISAGSSSTTCSAARTATVTYTVSSVATGYDFVGWYDSSTQKSTSDTYTYTSTEAKTITARFKKKQYTVSYGVYASSRWGSITLNSGSAVTTTGSSTLNHGTSLAFTASPNSGYQVEGWYSDAACSAGNKLQSGGTSYNAGTLTAAKTVYVKFETRTGGTVTLNAGSNGQVSLDNSSWGTTKNKSNITTNTAFNIYAKGNSGYQFSSWTKNSGSGTITSTSTANTTFTPVAYEDATITASFTEIMRSITISGGTTASTTAGVATQGTATAAAPAEGKKFTGWTLGSGVSLAGGYALTDRTIKFTTTSASTVTANYADRASVTMYFAKPISKSWSKVYAYAWKSSDASVRNAAYPGIELSTTTVVNGITYHVYQYYTEADGIGGAATGNSAWDKIVFGDNNDARKTGDLTIADGHYYLFNSATTGSETAFAAGWYIKGSMNSWSEGDGNAIVINSSTNTGSVTLSLTKDVQYELKAYSKVDNEMWTNNTALKDVKASVAATTLYKESVDPYSIYVTPSITGAYKFTVSNANTSTPTLAIDYPNQYVHGSWNNTDTPFDGDGCVSVDLTAGTHTFTIKFNNETYGCFANMTSTSLDYNFYTYEARPCTITVATAGKYVIGWNGTNHQASVIFPADNEKSTFTPETYIYFDISNSSNWKTDNPAAKFWFKNALTGIDIDAPLCLKSAAIDWIYFGQVPDNDYVGRVHMNRTDNSGAHWNHSIVEHAKDRDNKYQNCLVAPSSGWDDINLTWKTYCPPIKAVSLTDNSTVKYGSGAGTQANPYLVEKSTAIKVKATNTTYVDDPNMTAKYIFFDGATQKVDQTGSTYIMTANSGANVVHKMVVKPYNTYNGENSTQTLKSDTLYYKTVTCYSITYNGNGQTAGMVPSSSGNKYMAGTNVTVDNNSGSLGRSGYTFDGWNENATISGTAHAGGSTISAIAQSYTLYAKYKQTVMLNQNGATTNGSTSVTVVFNSSSISAITAPQKTGYTFGGWNTSADGTGYTLIKADGTLNSSQSSYVNSDGRWTSSGAAPTLYAIWTQNITLNQNGATTSGSTSLAATYNKVLDASGITNPSKTGYTFAGWTTGSGGSGTVVINASKVVTASVSNWTDGSKKWIHAGASTLYAKWTEDTHTVTVASGGNGTVSPTSVTGVGIATASGDITATPSTGYHFTSWTLPSGVTAADGYSATSNPIRINATADSKTITANFAANNYTVTLNKNGGTGGTSSIAVTYNSNTNLTATPAITLPTKDGYTFNGYNGKSNGTGKQVIDASGNVIASVATVTDASKNWIYANNATLYAIWTQNITLNQNGATTSGSTSLAATYNKVLNAADITNPSKTGYTFEGWTTGSGGTGDVVINASKVVQASVTDWTDSDKKWKHAGASTLYAKWSAIDYTVTYSAPSNGNYTIKVASGTASSASKTANYQQTITLVATPSTGYHFVSWTVTKAGGGTVTVTSNQFSMPADDVTVTATFAINTYAISYAAGTYGSGSLAGGSKTHGVAYTLSSSSSAFTRTGYTYDGWSTNAAGSSKDYNLGGSYTTNAAQTFYPHWVVTNYTISYDLAGGSVATPNPTSYTVESSAITLNNPMKDNYVFAGWTGTGLGEATTTVTIAAGSTGDRSYTATWTEAEASVTINGATTYYETIAGAFTAANASTTYEPTIKVLKDISGIATKLSFTNSSKNCTLDLNSHTIAGTVSQLLYVNSSKKLIVINTGGSENGKISLEIAGTAATYCAYVNKGTLQLDAGTIYINSTQTSKSAYAVGVNSSRTFTMNGGKVYAETTTRPAIGIYALGSSTTTINDGIIEAKSASTGYGVLTYSTTDIYGGKIKVNAASTGYGIDCRNGTTTVHDVDSIKVSGTAVYGAYVGGYTPTASASYNGVLNVENGVFEVTGSTGHAYGVYVYSGTATVDATTYHDAGTANISGGTFIVESKTASKYALGVFVGAALTDPVATPQAEITGGKFKLTAKTASYAYAVNTAAANTALRVQGGYYSVSKGLTGGANGDYVAPGKTPWDYYCFSTTAADKASVGSDYNYKVTTGYVITYNAGANGTGTVTAGYKAQGDDFTLSSSTFTRTGYTQTGWSTSDGGSKTYNLGGTYTTDAAITLYPFWGENSYDITFYNGGHGTVAVGGVTVANGGTAKVNHFTTKTLVATASTGYTFNGWTKGGTNASYVTIANTSAASTNIKATKTDANVTATWTANTYTVTLDKNGGDANGSATATYDATTLSSISAPTKTGYSVEGYYLEAGCTNKVATAAGALQASKTYTDASSKWISTSNQTLYTKWTANNYTVNYSAPSNGNYTIKVASGTASSASKTANYQQTITLAATPNTGYHFVSWTVTKAGGGTVTVTSNQFSMPADDVTVTATFAINTYAISYAAGTYGSGSLAGGTKTYNVAYTLSSSSSAFTRTGYTYDGWSTNAAGSSKDYNLGGSYTTNAAQTFYPHWVVTNYTISYDLAGGSVATPNPTSYTIESSAITLNNPTRDNYVFAGWTGTGLGSATTTVTIPAGSTGNRSYTATWTAAVAKVQVGAGTPTYYTTVSAAIGAANALTNPTVTMLQNTTTTEVSVTAAMTIDLNGKTVSSTAASSTSVFKINAPSKTVTITGTGTINHTASYSNHLYGVWLYDGSLNITGGTIHAENTGSKRAYGIYTSNNAVAISMSGGAVEAVSSSDSPFGIYSNNACNLTMTGGSFTATGSSSRAIYVRGTTSLTNATVTASGSSGIALYAKAGALTVNSGTYNATGASSYTIVYEAGTVTVNGGRFNGGVQELKEKTGSSYGDNVHLRGGYYVHNADLAANCDATYHVFDLDDATYNYEVAEGYTLTWNLNGGSISVAGTPAGTVKVGATVTAPTVTKTGYTFSAWSPAVVSPMPASDKTYTATWTAKQTTVTLNANTANHGSGANQSVTATYNAALPSFTATTPATGYHLVGYYTGATSGTKVINANGTFAANSGIWNRTDGATLTLYAHYEANTYTVVYNANDASYIGTATGSTASSSHTYDVAKALTSNGFSLTGYTFGGWGTTTGTSAATYTNGQSVTNLTSTDGGTVNLYARWNIQSYTLTWNLDGGKVTVAGTQAPVNATGSPSGSVQYGATVTAPTVTKTGYTFAGWSSDVVSPMPASAKTYTATWTPNTNTAYTVNHYKQNLAGDGYDLADTDNLTGTTGASVTPAVKSYIGFTAPSTQTVTILADGSRVVTYNYTRDSYTLTWNANGGTITGDYTSGSVKYGASITAPANANVTRANYEFAGWNTTPAATMPAANTTYTAQWTAAVASVAISGGSTTYYSTVTGAFTAANAATAAVTITMLSDASVTAPLTYSNTNTQNCTLDLNGYTITSTTSSRYPLQINMADVTFTITDNSVGKAGKLSMTSTQSSATIFGAWANTGNLVLEAGTIEVISSTHTTAGATAGTNGTFTMNGGTIHVQTTNSKVGYGTYYNGVVTINDGTIHVEAAGNACGVKYAGEGTSPSATVNGGKFNISGATAYATDNASNITIEGGWYTTNNNLASRVSAPYHVFDLDDATYNYEVALGYTLTWTTDGDALTGTYTSGTTKVGTTIVAPNTPTKTGYTFNAWSPTPAATMPAANTEYTATWTANTNTAYTVKHWQQNLANDDYTEVTGDRQSLTGTTATSTAAVAKTYTGFTAQSFSQGTIAPDGSTVVNIYYNRNKYTITWKSEDGTSTLETDSNVKYGATTAFNSSTPTKAATAQYTYTFDGWATSASGAKAYNNGSTPTASASVAYYAHFSSTVNNYTVTVATSPAGYGSVSATSIASVPYGTTVSTSSNTLTVTGKTPVTATPTAATAQYTYAFNNWTGVPATVTGNVTITANFTRTVNNYTVTFNMQGHGSAPSNQTIAYGGKVTQPSAPTATGYTFGGWYKEAGCTNAWNFSSDVVTGATTLYAKWTINSYTITFDSDGGSAVASITQNYGTAVSAPSAPTKTGYTFAGWDPAVPSTMPASNTTCVAQWTANTNTAYTVNHYQQNLDGTYPGSPTETDNLTGTTGASITPAVKSYTGFTAPSGTTVTISADGSTVVTYNYTRNSYTLTWNKGTGNTLTGSYTSGSVKYGASITAPNTPTKDTDATSTYTFSGWHDGSSIVTPATTMPANNLTYTAQFNATANVASVTVSGATTYYTTLAAAFTAANGAAAAPTIKILQDVTSGITTGFTYSGSYNCTLDLNNHTVTGNVAGKLLDINASGKTFTITDNSGEKGGIWQNECVTAARIYAVYLTDGSLVLNNGTVRAENKALDSFTSLSDEAKTYLATAVVVSQSKSFTMNNGKIIAEGIYTAYALHNAGTSRINNGEIKAVALRSYGGYVRAIYTSKGTTTVNGGTVTATKSDSYNNTYIYGIYVSGGTLSIPAASTLTANVTAYNRAYGLYVTGGTANVYGGTFNVTANNSRSYGIFATGGTTTFSSPVVLNVKSVGGTISSGIMVSSTATVNVEGGTFNVGNHVGTKRGSVYGVYHYANTSTYKAGTTNISGGEFKVVGSSTVYALLVESTATTASCNVSGGKFHVTGTSETYLPIASTTPTSMIAITGGEFNEKAAGSDFKTNVSGFLNAPYYTFDLASGHADYSDGYRFEVAEGYTLTWTTDGDALTGSYTSGTTKVGTTIVAPNTPTKSGYTFSAWTPAVVSPMPASDATYTATWTTVALTFTGDVNSNWNNLGNWSPACIPTIEHDVLINKPCFVDITNAQAKSVVLNQSSGKTGQLILEAGKELVVATTVKKTTDGSNRLATGENDLVFNSTSGAGLGALVMGTHDGTNNATVNFATLSNGEEDNTASDAQYVGTPFGNHPKMIYQFYNSWMYKFINTGVPGWTRVDGEDGLDAFQGYCIFSADGTGHTYWMQGTLVASEDQTISLRHNGGDGSNANNENMLANSWMAPIQIRAFDASDFTNADATIYIYNTGSPDDYSDNNGATSTGTQAGQYSLYTVNTCPTTAIIPSMQAFSVYTHGSTPSISLDYSKIVYDPAVAGSVVPGRNRAPQRTETDEPEKMRLYIGAESGYGDMLYMLEREDFAEGFENGWDGRKMFGEDVAPQLYAFTPDGNMAINCIPTFEGQLLGFRKGAQDNTYTFTFEYDGDNMWYLNDLKEQTSTLISAFDSYTFTSEADDTEARFIISRSPIHSTPTAVESATGAQQPAIRKIVINDHVFIIRNGLMYDVTGIMVR